MQSILPNMLNDLLQIGISLTVFTPNSEWINFYYLPKEQKEKYSFEKIIPENIGLNYLENRLYLIDKKFLLREEHFLENPRCFFIQLSKRVSGS